MNGNEAVVGDASHVYVVAIAGLIAAWSSFMVAVMSKEQKISEFRQAWIDALRNDISDFVSTMGTLLSFAVDKKNNGISGRELDDFIDKNYQEFYRASLLSDRIRLRLNPGEYSVLIDQMDVLMQYMEGQKGTWDFDVYRHLSDRFIRDVQQVLKVEWGRVKDGERVYVMVKNVSLVLLVAGGLCGFFWILSHVRCGIV